MNGFNCKKLIIRTYETSEKIWNTVDCGKHKSGSNNFSCKMTTYNVYIGE